MLELHPMIKYHLYNSIYDVSTENNTIKTNKLIEKPMSSELFQLNNL